MCAYVCVYMWAWACLYVPQAYLKEVVLPIVVSLVHETNHDLCARVHGDVSVAAAAAADVSVTAAAAAAAAAAAVVIIVVVVVVLK